MTIIIATVVYLCLIYHISDKKIPARREAGKSIEEEDDVL